MWKVFCSTNLKFRGIFRKLSASAMSLFWQKKTIIDFWQGFNPISEGPFRCCSRMGGGRGQKYSLPKIYHIYSPKMELCRIASYLNRTGLKKYVHHVTHPLSSADISIFSWKMSKFSYIKTCRYRLHFDT